MHHCNQYSEIRNIIELMILKDKTNSFDKNFFFDILNSHNYSQVVFFLANKFYISKKLIIIKVF